MQTYQSFHLTFNCPKAFDELKPCNGGWYCNGCHKVVHDFRGMDEQQIRDAFLKSGKNICGMYDADRINIGKKQPRLKKWLSAAMLTLGLNTLHHVVFAQNIDSISRSKITAATDTGNNNAVFGGVSEIMPEYPGGIEKFQKFITGKLKSHADLIGKKAIVTFVIEKNGTLSDIKITKKLNPDVDNELINALKQSAKWRPALRDGQPVRIQYSMPVTIKN